MLQSRQGTLLSQLKKGSLLQKTFEVHAKKHFNFYNFVFLKYSLEKDKKDKI